MMMKRKADSFYFFFRFVIFPAVFLLCGCAPLANKTMNIFSPSHHLRELSLDNATDLPSQEAALSYVIKRLNTTQYGIVLHDIMHKGSKPFEYTELYVTLKEKVTRDMFNENIRYDFWRQETLYIVEIASYCSEPDQSAGLPDSYAKSYFFASLEEAQKTCSGLIALGAKPCLQGSAE